MLYSSLLVAATAAFSGLASAQNGSSELPAGIQPCCTVDPNIVPASLKTTWCQAQRNTCPELCGGINELASTGQSCDPSTLKFTCECRNGTKPDMTLYQQSVPGLECRFWFDRCINATNQDLEEQTFCRNERDQKCGNLTTDAAKSSATPSASPSSTGGGSGNGGNSPSITGGAPSSASPTGAAALAFARDYSTPMLAGGLAAIFGLVL